MSVSISRCRSCQSMINLQWSTCLVCGQALQEDVRPEIILPGEIHPTVAGRLFRAVHNDPPIKPGWAVSFRGPTGQIEGGRVEDAHYRGGWIFTLKDGMELRGTEILSVAKVENEVWKGAWTVRDHGLSGEGLFE